MLIGRDVLGGSFVYDPFVLYRDGVVTNPNMVVFGQIGRGKSSFVKSYLWRQAVFGRRAWVVDPKGEYGPLAQAWGVAPVALRPGGSVRLNPLDTGDDRRRTDRSAAGDEAPGGTDRRRWPSPASDGSCCPASGRRSTPPCGEATDRAGRGSGCRRRPCPRWWTPSSTRAPRRPRALRTDPGRRWPRTGGTWPSSCVGWSTAICAACSTGPTTPGLGSTARWWCSTCRPSTTRRPSGSSWRAPPPGCRVRFGPGTANRIIVVVDEAWAILSNLGVARWLQASWKLSRAHGVANMAVLHRLSDLRVGRAAEGSEQVSLAEGLLADSETRVVYAQSPGEVARTGELLGLTDTEAELVTQLRRGVALWKVGRRSFLVEHRLAAGERWLTDTDQAMADGPAAPSAGGEPRRAAVRSGCWRRPPSIGRRRSPGAAVAGASCSASDRLGRRPSGHHRGRGRRSRRSRRPGTAPAVAGPVGRAGRPPAAWSVRHRRPVATRVGWSSDGSGGGWWPPSRPSR